MSRPGAPARFLACLGLLLGAAQPAAAATRYVAPLSTDCAPAVAGAGTLQDPWTNLFFALTQGALQAGDVLQLRGGTYQNAYSAFSAGCNVGSNGVNTVVPLTLAGTSASPIAIENYPGEDVLVDGTDADAAAATWTSCGTGIWQTGAFRTGSATTPQIWVNPTGPTDPGTRLRWNPSKSCTLNPGEFTVSPDGATTFVRLSSGADPGTADLHMSCQNGDCAAYPIHATATAQWVVVRSNAQGGRFRVKYGYYGLFVEGGASHLTFDGLDFISHGGRDYGSCVRVVDGDFITVRNGTCRETMGEGLELYGGGPGGGLPGIQIADDVLENMTVSATGRAWIDEGGNGDNLGMSIIVKNCDRCVVRGCRVSDCFGPAIHVTTSTDPGLHTNDVVVDGNTITNFGYLNATFGGRSVAAISYEPQTLNGMTGGLIQNNEIANAMATHGEWANGIRSSAAGLTPVSGLVIVNNSMNGLGAACIDLSENGVPATIRNNAMNQCSTLGPTCGGGGRCDVYLRDDSGPHGNNTFWSSSGGDAVVRVYAAAEYSRDQAASFEASAVQADPQFTSDTDLRLQPGSPLIDTGTSVDCPAVDHDGRARPFGAACDVGAFEHGAQAADGGSGTDAGASVDAGSDAGTGPGVDAGGTPDAGAGDAGAPGSDGGVRGCSCGTVEVGLWAWLGVLAALVARRQLR